MLSDNERDGEGERGKTRVTRTTSQDHWPGSSKPRGSSSHRGFFNSGQKNPRHPCERRGHSTQEVSWLQTSRAMLVSP